jgi:hypothetical protein
LEREINRKGSRRDHYFTPPTDELADDVDRLPLRRVAQMRVPLGCLRLAVAKDTTNDRQRHAGGDQEARN